MAVRVMELAEALMEASTIDEIWALHVRSMEGYGFDRSLYGITYSRTETSLGTTEDFLVLSNHPEEYIDAFVRSGLYLDAPMVRWAIENEGVASWRQIGRTPPDGAPCDREARVLDLNARFGLTAGYTISFRDTSVRTKAALGLCVRNRDQDHVDELWDAHGKEITFLSRLMHLKLASAPYKSHRRPLSPRQREVLEWVADGKTIQDISVLLGVTTATVEKHLRLAREALSAVTTAQALLKASVSNQIFVIRR